MFLISTTMLHNVILPDLFWRCIWLLALLHALDVVPGLQASGVCHNGRSSRAEDVPQTEVVEIWIITLHGLDKQYECKIRLSTRKHLIVLSS